MRPRHPAGFTLLEAVVGTCIVTVILTFSAPSLMAALSAHSLSGATRIATNHLRVVRAMAVTRQTRARLVASGDRLATDVFDTATNSWVRAGRGVVLGGGVTVAQVLPNGAIVFEREGTCTAAGAVRLRNTRGDERSVSVSILGAVDVS